MQLGNTGPTSSIRIPRKQEAEEVLNGEMEGASGDRSQREGCLDQMEMFLEPV